MKKKLLTILLSVFMMMTTFTTNVFADEPATIEELFTTYAPDFPKAIDSTVPDNAWISSNSNCYISQDLSKLCFNDGSWSSSLGVGTEVSKIDTNSFKCNSYNIIFNIENDKLISIERNYADSSSSLDGTYTAPVTVKSIIENVLPEMQEIGVPEGSWTNGTGYMFFETTNIDALVISDNDFILFYPNIGLDNKVNSDGDGNYIWTWVDDSNQKATFNFTDGVLTSVEIDGLTTNSSGDDVTSFNGTYYAPVTVADILYTVDGGYPASIDDETVPDGCWTTSDGYRLYYSSDNSKLKISDTPFISINASQPLTQDADENYIASISLDIFDETYNISFKMIMVNNKLQKIEATLESMYYYVFEPVGNNRKTLGMLFDTTGDKKPISTNAWVNENNNHIYIDDDYLTFSEANFALSLFACLKSSDNTYTENLKIDGLLPSNIKANMENDVLKSLTVDFSDADLDILDKYGFTKEDKDAAKKIRGTYSAPVTVADVLVMSKDPFPTDTKSGWINEAGAKIIVNNINNTIIVGPRSYSTNLLLTKNADGNYQLSAEEPGSHNNVTFEFIMESNELVKIKLTGSDTPESNGEYSPYKYTTAPTSIDLSSSSDVEFVTNGKYRNQSSTKVTVTVDGAELTYGTDYEVTTGSTHVKLKSSYLNTLANGEHTIKISMAGYVDLTSKFTITGATPTPSPSPSSDTTSGYKIPKTGVE